MQVRKLLDVADVDGSPFRPAALRPSVPDVELGSPKQTGGHDEFRLEAVATLGRGIRWLDQPCPSGKRV